MLTALITSMIKLISIQFILCFSLLLCACQGLADNTHPHKEPHITVPLLEGKLKAIPLKIEVADTPETLQQGLMFRKELPENQGMLFIFQESRYLSFWMKNTLIPLSIAFLDEHFVIVDIQDMDPLDETLHRSKKPARYALEVNQGWFKKHQIAIGDTLNVPLSQKKPVATP